MYSACVSIPSSSVSTETPRQTVSSFDHLVTQWTSTGISSVGRARHSCHVQPRVSTTSPMIERFQSSSDLCGVGPAERTGKSGVTYWPGGTRPDSASPRRRPWKPRETNDDSLAMALLPSPVSSPCASSRDVRLRCGDIQIGGTHRDARQPRAVYRLLAHLSLLTSSGS